MESDDKPRPTKNQTKKTAEKQKDKKHKHLINWKWTIRIALITFAISFAMTYFSESALAEVRILTAVIVLSVFILIGVAADIIGVAVTAADVRTFNSMAAKKVPGAKASLYFISKADMVSNIGNDVIGDICSIISGTMCSVLSVAVSAALNINVLIVTLVITAMTASVTVSLKSIGKNLALNLNESIVYGFSRVCCFILPERIFDDRKKK